MELDGHEGTPAKIRAEYNRTLELLQEKIDLEGQATELVRVSQGGRKGGAGGQSAQCGQSAWGTRTPRPEPAPPLTCPSTP